MPEQIHQYFEDVSTPTKNLKNCIPSDFNADRWEALNPSKKRKRNPTAANTTNGGRSTLGGNQIIKPPKAQEPAANFQVRNQTTQRGTRSTEAVLGNLKQKAKALSQLRKDLPIWAHASEIREGLHQKDFMLLVGETGSGKSTQVPQILLSEHWCRPKSVTATISGITQTVKVGGCIAVTEPRRVAAITLARRVAEEMGTPLGSSSPASKVGYSVRFDNSTSPSTQIKFVTEGMLLQELLRDPWLLQYSAVIVDEVHERGVSVDLLMGFLRNMNTGEKEGRGGIALRVAVMSATADLENLRNFFEEDHESKESNGLSGMNGNANEAFDPEADETEEESEWSGLSSSYKSDGEDTPGGVSSSHVTLDSKPQHEIPKKGHRQASRGKLALPNELDSIALRAKANGGRPLGHKTSRTATCYIDGRQFPVKTIYSPEPVRDFIDASLRTIFQIHHKEPMPGDILVFLTGQETVESLESLVNEYALGLGSEVPKLLVLPLFAALPQAAQQRVFQPAPPKTRKIILATNIAETSVTVSGVRFVIDCGKSKIKQFRSRIGLDSLLVKPISKSAATQRKGRAGREAPGQCYRLYTEQDYLALQSSNTPEILRCDLSQAILTMKARGVDDITRFPFLDRPPREALEKALLQLFRLQALKESGEISDIGLQMAKLPLSVSLARVLLAAADPQMNCLPEVIDIISCLSVENVFLNVTSEEKKEEAEAARRELYRREGDHLTLLSTLRAYAAERADRKVWTERHFVSHRAMQSVMEVRKQLRAQCQRSNSLSLSPDRQVSTLTTERANSILKCFLKGFATNTARLFPDGSYRTIVGNQTVSIHPSSGLFGKKVEAIMYNEFVFTNRSYARGVSVVQMDWIGQLLGV